ncbi:alpha-galactosidase [Acidobacterium sp. S8]|uniref:alpha-galactosidase n=1 Tax=Acidobacterium sp. S8 TaxID=1641854 RepID=UPI00131B657A|nr:alpha-galactosidase [Acidobacterium sp. S8]
MANLSRRDAGKVLLASYAGLLVGREALGATSPLAAANAIPQDAVRRPQPASQPIRVPRTAADSTWSDVLLIEGDTPTISYRTNWVVYEESFMNGQLVGRGWNGAGFINFYDGRLNPGEYRAPEAFRLEIDGQSLATDWKWGGLEKTTTSEGFTQSTITLIHTVRPVTLKVHTKLDGTPIITRWLEVTNTASQPAALASVCSWSGVLRKSDRWRSSLSGTDQPLYSLGYFENTRWGGEGDLQWHEMPKAGYRIDGRYMRDQWRHPIFMLRNNATGEFFIGQIAWTGGYAFEFDLNPESGKDGEAAALTFAAGPSAPAPLRVIAPKETVSTPEVHLGMVYGDLDNAVQSMHTHLRRSVFMGPARERRSWIESGIGPEIEITTEQVNHAIDVAIEVGAEVFFIDASWYAAPGGDWWKTVGDWEVNRQRFPEGIKPFRDRAHAGGMLWGLWMDAERVGASSRIAKEHPDWLAMNYDGKREMGGLLDLTNPEAAKWMESQIVRVIEENELDFFRLDYNTDPGRGIRRVNDGFVENGYWRYYETVYGVYDRLRARFPKVIFENCAGGGARTDIGMVRRFNHTDATDWQIAPRSFMITNGMTMALPPEYVDRLLGGQDGQTAADFDFQSRLLLFMEPKFGFLYPIGAQVNPIFMQRTKHWIDIYKNFVRSFISTSQIYHHTPTVSGLEPHGWGVLEMGSEDQGRSICALFQLSMPTQPEYRLHPRGLDVSKHYKVTFDNSGRSTTVDAFTLMEQGILVRLEGALTSELLIFEAV